MGGRGSSSASQTTRQAQPTPTAQAIRPQQQAQPQKSPSSSQAMNQAQQAWGQNQAPKAPMQTTLKQLASMDDQSVLSLLQGARGIDMPNHLKDAPSFSQEFVYAIGLNAQPNVVDAAGFNKFMSDNNIPRSQILSRMTGGGTYKTTAGTSRKLSADQVVQMWATDPYNYIGGKHGGQVYGAGAYFDMNGGRNTGYGGANASQIKAALNPNVARPISRSALQTKFNTWARSHPQSAQMINRLPSGDRLTLQALVTGYNVITDGYNSYHNIIDRSAVTITF